MPASKNTTFVPAAALSNANPTDANPTEHAQPEPTQPEPTQPKPTVAAWQRARERLELSKARIAGQINSYPTPITGCDAQFDYLLEQRGKLTEELGRLEAARRDSTGKNDGGAALADIISSSEFLDVPDG